MCLQIRDPLERLLSTYLDKCENVFSESNKEIQNSKILQDIRQNYIKFGICSTNYINSFPDFVSYLFAVYAKHGYKYLNGHIQS